MKRNSQSVRQAPEDETDVSEVSGQPEENSPEEKADSGISGGMREAEAADAAKEQNGSNQNGDENPVAPDCYSDGGDDPAGSYPASVYLDQMNSLINDDGEYLEESNELRLDRIEDEDAKKLLKECYDGFTAAEADIYAGNPYASKRVLFIVLSALFVAGSVPLFMFLNAFLGTLAIILALFFAGFVYLTFRPARKVSCVQLYRRADRNVLIYIRPGRDITYYRAANKTVDVDAAGECFLPESPTNFTTVNIRFVFGMLEGPLSVCKTGEDTVIRALDRSIAKRALSIGPDGRPKSFSYENYMTAVFTAFDQDVVCPALPEELKSFCEATEIPLPPDDMGARYLEKEDFAAEFSKITL